MGFASSTAPNVALALSTSKDIVLLLESRIDGDTLRWGVVTERFVTQPSRSPVSAAHRESARGRRYQAALSADGS